MVAFNYVNVFVSNMARSVAFYRDIVKNMINLAKTRSLGRR